MIEHDHSSRILVVDDDPVSVKVLVEVLKRLGYENVQSAPDGASAISKIASFEPSLVIADIAMTPVDGVELLGTIRMGKYGLPPQLPVVMYSGVTDRAIVSRCIALDVNGFIVKPVSIDKVGKHLRSADLRETPHRSADYYQGVMSGMTAGGDQEPTAESMHLLAPASHHYVGHHVLTHHSDAHASAHGAAHGHGARLPPYLVWREEYSVHSDVMDSHHMEIINLINLAFQYRPGTGEEMSLPDIASRLLDYTKRHFNAEEQMLTRIRYPRLEEHAKLHRAMIEQTWKIVVRIQALEDNIGSEVFRFLKEWWMTHILTADRAYGEYLISIGAKE